MDLGLKDRVAIVAASSQGIGKAIALGFAAEGARLAICARSQAALEKTAAEIGAGTLTRTLDVTEEAGVRDFVQATLERFGRIDICVTNAGGPPARRFDETSVEDWRSAVDLNFMSTLYFAREVLPLMKEQGWGRLITITSMSVRQPIDGLILSNSVRSAVRGLVKSLSNEYAAHNVLVNNVCPGYTATERLRRLNVPVEEIPLGRLGRPEEIANVAVFLASERAAYITGQSIAVDGGWIQSS